MFTAANICSGKLGRDDSAMLTVIQIIDSDSQGHKVRLSDGSLRYLRLHPGYSPTVGTEVEVDSSNWGTVQHVADPDQGSTSVEIVNSEAQVAANILSQHVHVVDGEFSDSPNRPKRVPFVPIAEVNRELPGRFNAAHESDDPIPETDPTSEGQ